MVDYYHNFNKKLMKTKISKNYNFLSLFNLSHVEKYLQEIVNLSFEYSSYFIFSYNINDFRQIPINLFSLTRGNESHYLYKFLNLLNVYLEKDCFFTNICFYLNLKFKLKFTQFIQLVCFRGNSDIKNFSVNILSNLQYGLTLKDFILSSFKTRESILDSSVNIYSSGYLTKKLVECLRNVNIKEIKCNTQYLCKNYINNEFLSVPFLCSNNKSVCSYCLNVFNSYNMFLGYNKGVVSGQALGEPSTQMLLRTFHLGGSVGRDNNFKYAGKNDYFYSTFNSHYTGNISYILNTINCKNYSKKYFNKFIKFGLYNNFYDIFDILNVKFISLVKNFKSLWCSNIFYRYSSNHDLIDFKNKEHFKYINYYKY